MCTPEGPVDLSGWTQPTWGPDQAGILGLLGLYPPSLHSLLGSALHIIHTQSQGHTCIIHAHTVACSHQPRYTHLHTCTLAYAQREAISQAGCLLGWKRQNQAQTVPGPCWGLGQATWMPGPSGGGGWDASDWAKSTSIPVLGGWGRDTQASFSGTEELCCLSTQRLSVCLPGGSGAGSQLRAWLPQGCLLDSAAASRWPSALCHCLLALA